MENNISIITYKHPIQKTITPKTKQANISFGSSPIYAITHNRQVIGFDSLAQAAEKTGLIFKSLRRNIGNGSSTSTGLVFKHAKDILDENGEIDFRKVKKFAEKIKSFCVIDTNANIYETNNKQHAASILGRSIKQFNQYLCKKKITSTGKMIVKRSSIEDDFGNLDPTKAQAIINKAIQKKAAKHELAVNRRSKGFYAVDTNYNATFWRNAGLFAKEIGSTYDTVFSYLSRKGKIKPGYALIRPELIEDSSGAIDPKKLRIEANKQFYGRRIRPMEGESRIIALHKDGQIKYFNSMNDASAQTNQSKTNILNMLNGRKTPSKSGWYYLYSDKCRDENGKIIQSRLQETYNAVFNNQAQKKAKATPAKTKKGRTYKRMSKKAREILAININGETTKFINLKEASLGTQKAPSTIRQILKSKDATPINGWFYSYVKNLKDKHGIIQQSKIEEIRQKVFKREEIIAISKQGEIKNFPSEQEAATELTCDTHAILRILKGKGKNTKSGWHFTYASKLKNENGEIDGNKVKELQTSIFGISKEPQKTKEIKTPTLPKEVTPQSTTPPAPTQKIAKIEEKQAQTIDKTILAINRNGEAKVFKNKTTAEKETNTTSFTIGKILDGKIAETKQGWHFAYARTLRDETGRIPKKSVKELYDKLFGTQILRYTESMVKNEQIIGLNRNGSVKIFANLQQAKIVTNNSGATILNILNGNKLTTNKGWHFVFPTALKNENGKLSKEKIKQYFLSIFQNN